jgi:hypothetical protein
LKYHFRPAQAAARRFHFQYGTHTQSTQQPDWLRLPEVPLAEVRTEDNTVLQLTERHLYVKTAKGLRWRVPLRELGDVRLEVRRLLLPMVVGGFLSPLLFLGLLKGVIYGWLGMFLAFLGLLLFYYGWQGKYQLLVMGRHFTRLRLFLPEPDRRIKDFVGLCRKKIRGLSA